MTSASQLLACAITLPARDDCTTRDPFVCWVCGHGWRRGMARSDFMGATFVGQNRVRAPASSTVCEPCASVMAGRPPDTMRMYSHLLDDRGYHRLNKGDKPAMRAWLRGPHTGPWFAAIADSGQKHTIPWAPVNPPGGRGGRVMLEETLVALPSAPDGWSILDDMTVLLTEGATKAEIESGDYVTGAIGRCEARIRAFERMHARTRTSPWFELALWLAQRDEAAVAARLEAEKLTNRKVTTRARRASKRAPADAHRGDDPRRPSGVPGDAGSQRAHALEPDPGPRTGERAPVGERRAVVHGNGAVSSSAGAQRVLFGDADGAVARGPRAAVRE